MTKEELIQILKNYRENKSKLRLRQKEWEKLERTFFYNRHPELEKGITSTYGINNDIKSKNSISNKTENAIIQAEEKTIKVLEEQAKLEKEIKYLKDLVEEADIRLESLYKKEREILTAYYVDNREAEEIGRNLYFKLYNRTCSAENIYRIVKKATEKLTKL